MQRRNSRGEDIDSAGFVRAVSDETEENDVGEACALVGHDDGRIQLVDVATGHELKLFDGHKEKRRRAFNRYVCTYVFLLLL